MKVTRIIFVRHGDHINNRLTPLGKKQAKMVCHELAYENIGKVFCSPSGRALETAKIICKKLKLPAPIVEPILSERNRLTHDPVTPEEVIYHQNYLNPAFSSTSPEGCKEFMARTKQFLDSLQNQTLDAILIVGHSCFAYTLNAYFTKTMSSPELAWVRIGNCSKICYEIRHPD